MNDNHGGTAVQECEPGELMRLVAESLTARGFEISGPEWEDSRRLTITNLQGTRCQLTVGDSGCMALEYWPHAVDYAGPANLTNLVMTVLDNPREDQVSETVTEPVSDALPGVPLKGVVGRALKAKGMDVRMIVYEDVEFYDVLAEIVVTNPDRLDRGEVRVGDDAAVLWECEYPAESDSATDQIVENIVDMFTRAVSAGREKVT